MRIALKNNTVLKFTKNNHSFYEFKITEEIGRGGSCIVYSASYQNNTGTKRTVRIKECFPFKLSLSRDANNNLVVSSSNEEEFYLAKDKFRCAFDLGNKLFESSGLTNFTVNTLDIYEANNTLYVVSTYQEGKTLSLDSFALLKDYLSVVKSVSQTISKIHNNGFLYLDTKPDNVLVLNGTTELVQLFDFDTLLCLDKNGYAAKNEDYRIYFTKGFSAPEQQLQQYRKIGTWTDVYSVGALLFYLIFEHTPNASDCRKSSIFDYDLSKFSSYSYQNKLFTLLTEFFHNTIANYYLDRYQTMGIVIEKLDEIIRLSDTTVPYILSTQITTPAVVFGRNDELKKLNKWLHNKRTCLFVTGMGGIGKSTLVRKLICENRSYLDNVLYLYYNGSICDMINNDNMVHINTIEHEKGEKNTEYFKRKIRRLSDILNGTNSIIVIDNFDGEITEDFLSVLDIDCKVIVISRSKSLSLSYDEIVVSSIDDKSSLYSIFNAYAEVLTNTENNEYVNKIIDATFGHPLALELIAKQIKSSHLTTEEAYSLLKQYGLFSFATEQVNFEKDRIISKSTINQIISTVFSLENQSFEKRVSLKVLSLFDMPGVNIRLFKNMLNLHNLDSVNELITDGWLCLNGDMLYLHPVIKEIIQQWEWTTEYYQKSIQIIEFLNLNFNEYLVESILSNLKHISCFNKTNEYRKLLYQAIIKATREREDFILEKSFEYILGSTSTEKHLVANLYERIVLIYNERGDFDNSEKILNKIRDIYFRTDPYIKAKYYNILADFYDARLNGEYDCDNNYSDLKSLIKSIDKSIHYIKFTNETDSKSLLAKYIISKANVLMRSRPNKQKKIWNLLQTSKKLIEEICLLDDELNVYYNMSCAWYFTVIVPDLDLVEKFTSQADEISKRVANSELDRIDDVLVPLANMLFELGEYKSAEVYLYKAIHICDKYESLPYIRKKEELYSHLADIYEDDNMPQNDTDLLDLLKK